MENGIRMQYDQKQTIDMRRGERRRLFFYDRKTFEIQLEGYDCRFEPFFTAGSWYHIFRQAEVRISVNGRPASVFCGPYRLPQEINGLQVSADLVREAAGGAKPIEIEKDVRFTLLPAGIPWVPYGEYRYPMRDYRWRASNYSHTWNEFVSVHTDTAAVYYHRGEDFGAVPGRHDYVSMIEGRLSRIPGRNGDGGSNVIEISGNGVYCKYCHSNVEDIVPSLRKGQYIRRGQKIAKTGNTWNGGPAEDPHLHFDLRTNENQLNTYPIMIQAYREQYPDEILPHAGGVRFCKAGTAVTHSAECTVRPPRRHIERYHWFFCDGTEADGAVVEKLYPQKGTFTEELRLRDERGRVCSDFVIVRVSDGHGELPYAFINYYPVRRVLPGDEVEFLITVKNMEQITVDFGDAEMAGYRERMKHDFNTPGLYTVTVSGRSREGVKGVFKVQVIVDTEEEQH